MRTELGSYPQKREALKEAFRGFDPLTIATFGERDVTRIMATDGVIHSERKIRAVIKKMPGPILPLPRNMAVLTAIFGGIQRERPSFTKGMGQGPSRPPMAYPGLSAGTLRSGAFPLSDLSPFIPILKLSASSTIMMNHVLAIKRSLASAMRSGPIPLKKADLFGKDHDYEKNTSIWGDACSCLGQRYGEAAATVWNTS